MVGRIGIEIHDGPECERGAPVISNHIRECPAGRV